MNKITWILIGLLNLVTLGIWVSGGCHAGWTQTTVEVTGMDEVTGLEYTTTEEGFVPGIEFPVVGGVGGLMILGLSFAVKTLSSRMRS